MEHKEMESVRDPNVDPSPDHCKIWEALSQYLFHCQTFHPPKLSPARGIKDILPVAGKPN